MHPCPKRHVLFMLRRCRQDVCCALFLTPLGNLLRYHLRYHVMYFYNLYHLIQPQISDTREDMLWPSGNRISEPVPHTPKRRYTFVNRACGRRAGRFPESHQLRRIDFHVLLESACICAKKCHVTFKRNVGLLPQLLDHRNAFQATMSRCDRRLYLRRVVGIMREGYSILGIRVCVRFVLKIFGISRNLLYGVVHRERSGAPVSISVEQPM